MFSTIYRFFPKRKFLFLFSLLSAMAMIAITEILSISLLPFFFGDTGGGEASNQSSKAFRSILDRIFSIESNGFETNLLIFCIIFIIKNILTISLRYFANLLIMVFSTHFEKNLFNMLLKSDSSRFSSIKKSEINQLFFVEIQNSRTYFLQPFTNFLIELVLAIALFTLLLILSSSQMQLALFSLFLLMGLVIYLISNLSRYYGNQRVILQEKFSNIVKDFQEGFLTIKSYKNESNYLDNFWLKSLSLSKNKAKGGTISASSGNIVEIVLVSFMPLIYFLIFKDSSEMNIVAAATYSLIFYRLYPSLSRMTNYLNRMKNGLASIKFISDFSNKFLKEDGNNFKELKLRQESEFLIILEKLSVVIKDKELFQNLDLAFRPQGMYLVEGENGSGKSTLSQILIGIMAGNEGTLYRKENISLVAATQQPFIEHATLKDNILFYLKEIDNDILDKLLEIFNFNDFYEANKFKIIGDGGEILSGGQAQKVNLIRALVRDSDIIILDEPLAALDGVTKFKFLSYLQEIASKKLIIIISHEELLIPHTKISLNKNI